MRDETLHTIVVRSTCRSQNVQNTILGALLEVEMSKKCTPVWREAHFEVKVKLEVELWRKAHFQVKLYKALHVWNTFEVEKSKKCTPLRREAHFEVKSVRN